ncbi:MAG: SocA family protein, partial [Planctomycetia bacterium]|nr:SocA family protein [Planctomycetia bacterium]
MRADLKSPAFSGHSAAMPRISATHRPDDDKLQELILFVASRSEDDQRFGSTKLNKLLFFADFLAYVKLGKAITGHTYQKLENGPAPRAMLPIIKRMIAEETLAIQERDHFGRTQKVPIALRQPNLKRFSSDEVAIITEVLDAFRRKNAKGISTLSHQFAGWKLATEGEDIPYEVALVQFKKPRKKDIEKALEMRVKLAALRRESRQSDADQ